VAGLREIFAERPEVEVIPITLAEALKGSGFDAMLVLIRKQADANAVLDRLRARHPAVKTIAVGEVGDDHTIMAAILAGAKGWLLETASPAQVREALNIVMSGSIWGPRRVLSQLVTRALEESSPALRPRYPRFTTREEEVLQQLVLARSNREIALALSIREQTVKSYVARLMKKMGVDNRIALSMQVAECDWWRNRS
jgi:DNA-binding NarL/FixJ family response regulator